MRTQRTAEKKFIPQVTASTRYADHVIRTRHWPCQGQHEFFFRWRTRSWHPAPPRNWHGARAPPSSRSKTTERAFASPPRTCCRGELFCSFSQQALLAASTGRKAGARSRTEPAPPSLQNGSDGESAALSPPRLLAEVSFAPSTSPQLIDLGSQSASAQAEREQRFPSSPQLIRKGSLSASAQAERVQRFPSSSQLME